MESGGRNDARVRGNAQQLLEKYKGLARDAASAGDRILAEYYMQHADHYHRVLAEFRSRFEDSRPQRERDGQEGDAGPEPDPIDIQPQGFAASAAVQTFGVEGPAAESTPAPAESEAGEAEVAEVTPAAEAGEAEEPRRRRRGRPRKTAEPATEPADA